MQGKVQILHSITYEGTYSSKTEEIESLTPFSDWIKKCGRTSRDQISCVAANAPIGSDPDLRSWDRGNGTAVYGDPTLAKGSAGFGFLMKGYPAFAAEEDVMTQTLSALSDDLKDFHKNSGQVKRASSIDQAINPRNWKGINELILDNWTIIGIYITELKFPPYGFARDEDIIADALKQGLPVYKVDYKNHKMTKVASRR